MIPIFSNTLGKEELEAVDRVFQSRWIGPGKENDLFEKELGEKIGTDKVLSLSSCTAGLFMSMKILNIGVGDEVIIPTVHFIGAVNAIVECGATPVFADVNVHTLNILPNEISRLRTDKTKAVFLLHYGGHPCDMDAIYKVLDGLHLIEDGANSPFSKYKGTNCGLLGDIGIYSFDAMKILCVGGGGAMVFKSEGYYNKAKEYRYFGLKNKKQTGIDSFKENKDRWWEIELACTSNKSTQTDILSAVARVQLSKVDGFIARRKEIWNTYQYRLSDLDWLETPPEPLLDTTSSYYMYWVKVGASRDKLARYLVENGIYCTFRYYPLHLIKYFNSSVSLPNSELINETTLNIPLHQNLTNDDVAKITDTIRGFKC